jgi:hypothetical protein
MIDKSEESLVGEGWNLVKGIGLAGVRGSESTE